MARDFSRRSDETELMDADDTDYDTFRACLHDLAEVNVATFAHWPTLAFLDALRLDGRFQVDRPIRIVDVGSGYGDLLRRIDRWGLQHQTPLDLTGVDLNPWSARAASEVTAKDRPIRWVTENIFNFDGEADVVICSLFTHHLTDDQLTAFLGWMDRSAAIGWHINDLHRHAFPFHGFNLLARLMRWHPFVQHDGPISIARAFSHEDWRTLVAAAGLAPDGVDIRWQFPFRLCVSRVKPEA